MIQELMNQYKKQDENLLDLYKRIIYQNLRKSMLQLRVYSIARLMTKIGPMRKKLGIRKKFLQVLIIF